jgi:hypothetical protein
VTNFIDNALIFSIRTQSASVILTKSKKSDRDWIRAYLVSVIVVDNIIVQINSLWIHGVWMLWDVLLKGLPL